MSFESILQPGSNHLIEQNERLKPLPTWEAVKSHLVVPIIPRVLEAQQRVLLHIAQLRDSHDIELQAHQFIDLENETVYNSLLEAIKARNFSDFRVENVALYGKEDAHYLYGIKDDWSSSLGEVTTIEEKTGMTIEQAIQILTQE